MDGQTDEIIRMYRYDVWWTEIENQAKYGHIEGKINLDLVPRQTDMRTS